MKTISESSQIKRIEGIISSPVDHELVMFNAQRGEYYGLNDVGARIWQFIENPCLVEDLVKLLMRDFDVEYDQCLADTLEFLNALYVKGLIEL